MGRRAYGGSFFPDFRRDILAYKITGGFDKCVGDGGCVGVGPGGVDKLQGGQAVAVNEGECLGCESCGGVGGQDAITVEEA